MTVHARATFDYTIDDLVDVAVRNALRRARTQFRAAALIGAVVIGGAATLWAKRSRPDDLPFAIAIGAVCAIVFAAIYTHRFPKRIRRAARRALLERCGPGPFTCTVELHGDQIVWRDDWQSSHQETCIPWADLHAILRDGDDWIVASRTGISMLRGRAFATRAEADAFFATLEGLQAAACP